MMSKATACDALRRQLCLELRYDGFTRVVEVHTVGDTEDGNGLLSIWQVRGGSNSNERQGWKTFRIDETFSAHVIEEKSKAPRPGYKRGAKMFSRIDCQV